MSVTTILTPGRGVSVGPATANRVVELSIPNIAVAVSSPRARVNSGRIHSGQMSFIACDQQALIRFGSTVVEPGSDQVPRETPSFCGSGLHQVLNGRDGIGLRCVPLNEGNVHILSYTNRHEDGLVDAIQRLMQAVVLNEQVGIGELD